MDVFLVADKQRGVDDLVSVREEICRRHITGDHRVLVVPDPPRDRAPQRYGNEVRDWHAARAETYETVLREQVRAGGETVGFLVWGGDPSLYDSTIRVVERIRERGGRRPRLRRDPPVSAACRCSPPGTGWCSTGSAAR